jgi:hypothetical protein
MSKRNLDERERQSLMTSAHRYIPTLVFFILAGINAPAMAQGAPAGLRGKSVVASWNEIRLPRLGGIGEFTERSVANSLSAYVSTEGRIFAKRTVWASGSGRRRGSGSQTSVGDNSGGAQVGSMQGRSLVIVTKFAGGARMARIDFDSSFSSCTANVVLGREGGSGIARGRSQITGAALEIKSARVENPSCSIRSGNVFGE